MKKIFSLLTACLLSLNLLAQSAEPTQNPTDCTNAFFTAMLNEDGTLAGKVTTNDFMIINFDGQTADRDLLIQALGGGYVVFDNAAASGMATRTYNDNTAIVTGNWKTKGNIQGQAFDGTSFFTAVCVKQNNAWKVASLQLTSVK